jgi:hypothetical protein
MAGWFGKAADQATSWLWAQIGSATAINLDSPQLRTDLLATGAIALTLTLALFLVQVITSVLRCAPAGLGRAAKGLLIALVMSVFAFSVTKILLGVVDQLSEGVISYTMGTDIAGLGKRLALGSVAGVTNPGQQLTQIATGSLILLLAGFAPWAAIKMFHFTGDALHSAHATAAPSGADRPERTPEGQRDALPGLPRCGQAVGQQPAHAGRHPPSRGQRRTTQREARTKPAPQVAITSSRIPHERP